MRTIVVSVDKAGHVNQCLAFCEAAGWTAAKVVRIPAPGRMMRGWDRFVMKMKRRLATRRAMPRTRSGGRLRIVASGAAAEAVVAGYRALYGEDLFAIFIGRPDAMKQIYDVALMARHALKPGEEPEHLASSGARHLDVARGVMVRRMALQPDPRGLMALIGGVNKAYDIDANRIIAQLSAMASARPGEQLAIAFSRRTSRDVEASIRRAFADFAGSPVRFVGRKDRKGFEEAVARSAEFVVTPDSLTMTCEVCATGRPVRVFDLFCFDPAASTHLFVRDFLASGYVSPPQAPVVPACPPELFGVPAVALKAFEAWMEAAHALQPTQLASAQAR